VYVHPTRSRPVTNNVPTRVTASADEYQTATALVSRSVTQQTMERAGKAWDTWRAYLETVDIAWRPDNWMANVSSSQERAIRLVLFGNHLYERGQREEQVHNTLSSLHLYFSIKGGDLTFYYVYEDGSDVGGEHLRTFLGGRLENIKRISRMELKFRTSKTAAYSHEIARRSPCEEQVLEDVCLWIWHSKVQDMDELCTRYPTEHEKQYRRKVATRKEYSSIFPLLAKQGNVESSCFSSKSTRQGFATCAAMDGLSSEEINRGGGWAPTSSTPKIAYIPAELGTGPTVVGKGNPTGKPLGAWARAGRGGRGSLTLAHLQTLNSTRNAARESMTQRLAEA
jgi:hypothetical protein